MKELQQTLLESLRRLETHGPRIESLGICYNSGSSSLCHQLCLEIFGTVYPVEPPADVNMSAEDWYDRLAKRRESVWSGEYGENRYRVLRQLIEHLEHRLEGGDA